MTPPRPHDDPPGDDWLIVGFVRRPRGLRGEMAVEIVTDFPERMTVGTVVGHGGDDGPRGSARVRSVRTHGEGWLLALEGVDDRDAAEEWRGRYLYLPPMTADELPEGYLYEHQIVGLEVRDPDGRRRGTVVEIEGGSGQPRLVVEDGRRRWLVPWAPALVETVDVDAGVVIVRPVPGLLDDDSAEG